MAYENKTVKMSEGDDYQVWRIPCECTDSDHDCDLWFDAEDGHLLSLDMMVYYPARKKSVFHRIADGIGIMFGRSIPFYGNVYLDERGIEGMRDALAEGKEFVRERLNAKGS